MPVTPLPVTEAKSVAARCSDSPRSVAAATMAAASGCSLDRSRLAASGRSSALVKPGAGTTATTARLALGQRAGLVDDQRVDLLHALQRLGRLDQHAAPARPCRRRP